MIFPVGVGSISYETGTFTPLLAENETVVSDATYGAPTAGSYTKIGNTINFGLVMGVSNIGSAIAGNSITVKGLPYTDIVTDVDFPLSFWCTGLPYNGWITGYVNTSTGTIYLKDMDTAGTYSYVTFADVTGTFYIQAAGCYIINE